MENLFFFFAFYLMINRRLAGVLGVLPHIPYYRVCRIPRTGIGRFTRVSRRAHDRDRVSCTRTRTDGRQ